MCFLAHEMGWFAVDIRRRASKPAADLWVRNAVRSRLFAIARKNVEQLPTLRPPCPQMRGSRFAPPCAADVAEYLTNDSDVDQGSGSDGEEPCPAQTQTQTRA